MPVPDLVMSVVMYVISGIMFWQMENIKSAESRIFPTAIAILIILLSTILLLSTLLSKSKNKYNFDNTLRGMKLFAILLVFAVCTSFFGFFSCVPFFLFSAMYFLGQRNKVILIAVTVCMTIAVILMFDVIFKVRLPEGSLFDLYAIIFK